MVGRIGNEVLLTGGDSVRLTGREGEVKLNALVGIVGDCVIVRKYEMNEQRSN